VQNILRKGVRDGLASFPAYPPEPSLFGLCMSGSKYSANASGGGFEGIPGRAFAGSHPWLGGVYVLPGPQGYLLIMLGRTWATRELKK
jgi:hypothetical protein